MIPLIALHGLASLSMATVTAPTISGDRPARMSPMFAVSTFGYEVEAMAAGMVAESPSSMCVAISDRLPR